MNIDTVDPIIEAFDRMTPSEKQLECGCFVRAPRSLSCQSCEHLQAHVREGLGLSGLGGTWQNPNRRAA
jgi:hypothetical protein